MAKSVSALPHYQERNFFTIEDLMEIFHLERESVLKHFAKAGDIPYRKRGTIYIWSKKAIDEWLEGDDRPNDSPLSD